MSPAPAGMIPELPNVADGSKREPRTRGDDPSGALLFDDLDV